MLKKILLFLLCGALAAGFLYTCLLLPAYFMERLQTRGLNAVSVQPMGVVPTERPASEKSFSWGDALTLLYLSDLYDGVVDKLAVSEGFDMAQAERNFCAEYELLRAQGFSLPESYTISYVRRNAYAGAVNNEMRAELLMVSVSSDSGNAQLTADAATGKILRYEQYFEPSESQLAGYDADSRAFAAYLELGDLVYNGESKGAYNQLTETFYAKDYGIRLEVEMSGRYRARAYPAAAAGGGIP